MPKSRVPFWFAIEDNTVSPVKIHLFMMVYAEPVNNNVPVSFQQLSDLGNKARFTVASTADGTTAYSRLFSFDKGTLNTIQISFNYSSGDKEINILIADLDKRALSSITQSGQSSAITALEVPYVFTHLHTDNDGFDAELLIIPNGGKSFSVTQTQPPIPQSTDPKDKEYNSSSVVTSSAGTNSLFDLTHSFDLLDTPAREGGHTFEYSSGSGGPSRTKNKNHTKIPFPRPRKKVKIGS